MQIIPLQPVPAQSATFTVSGQSYQVDVLQKRTGMFVDLYANNTLVIAGAIGQDRNPMVRSAYLGVPGDLIFYDTQGEDDPQYAGLGTRWFLAFLEPGDGVPATS